MKLSDIPLSVDVVTSADVPSFSGHVQLSADGNGLAEFTVGASAAGTYNRTSGIGVYGRDFAYVVQQLDPGVVSASLALPVCYMVSRFATNDDRKFIMQDGALSDFTTQYPPADGTVVLDSTLPQCASQALADALWPFLSAKVKETAED